MLGDIKCLDHDQFYEPYRLLHNSVPTGMRKGCEELVWIIREVMRRNLLCYDEAFIFYSKDYKKVKMLHYDYMMYEEWFDDGRFLQPAFEESKSLHLIFRETLILLLSTAVQYKQVI